MTTLTTLERKFTLILENLYSEQNTQDNIRESAQSNSFNWKEFSVNEELYCYYTALYYCEEFTQRADKELRKEYVDQFYTIRKLEFCDKEFPEIKEKEKKEAIGETSNKVKLSHFCNFCNQIREVSSYEFNENTIYTCEHCSSVTHSIENSKGKKLKSD